MSYHVTFLEKLSFLCFSFDSLLYFIAQAIEINWYYLVLGNWTLSEKDDHQELGPVVSWTPPSTAWA